MNNVGGDLMRRGNQPDGCLLTLVCIIGVIAFLVIEHPLFFWLIFLPIAAVLIIGFITWLKKG